MIGALNQGLIADKISRKYSIVVAAIVFTVGSVLQTASVSYATLVVAIAGIRIGMLSMVAPLYISEISPLEIRELYWFWKSSALSLVLSLHTGLPLELGTWRVNGLSACHSSSSLYPALYWELGYCSIYSR